MKSLILLVLMAGPLQTYANEGDPWARVLTEFVFGVFYIPSQHSSYIFDSPTTLQKHPDEVV